MGTDAREGFAPYTDEYGLPFESTCTIHGVTIDVFGEHIRGTEGVMRASWRGSDHSSRR